MTLVCALVALIGVAGGYIVLSLEAARQQDGAAISATALRYSADLLEGRMSAEQNSLSQYSLTRDASHLVIYSRDRQRALAARDSLASLPDQGTVDGERSRLLETADELQVWLDDLRAQVEVGALVPPDFYERGTGIDSSLDAETALFDLRAVSAAATAQDASAAADHQILTATIVGVGLGIAGLLVLAWLFFIGNLRPIGRLAAAASRLSVGADAVIPIDEGTREIRELSQALTVWRGLTEGRLTLAEDMAAVNEQVDPDEVLARAGRLLARQFSAGLVGIGVLDDEGVPITHLTAEPGMGTSGLSRGPEVPGAPITYCRNTRRPLITDMRDPRWPTAVSEFGTRVGLGSLLLVPMISAGELVGVVAMARRTDLAVFTEDDLSRACMTVPQVAASLNAARLIKYLEYANRHKTEFLAHMSHELRTPLNSILGFAQLLAAEDFGPLNERQRRYIANVENSGAHLLSLINDVLDLTKVEAGQLELDPDEVLVMPLLAACIEEMGPLAKLKSLSLELLPRGAWAVRADPRRLRQVVLNLLSNAVKFTPKGGTITLETERDRSDVLIHVRDNGVGVPAAERERIFDAFTQVLAGRTRNVEGTGLGLTVSRRLMDLMGGSLTLDSGPEQGATFTMRLPAATEAPAAVAV
ncbi:MAG TPA: GAF domain-containing sensor histidine kinase [Candidatus Dormibacteraeota bacterium]